MFAARLRFAFFLSVLADDEPAAAPEVVPPRLPRDALSALSVPTPLGFGFGFLARIVEKGALPSYLVASWLLLPLRAFFLLAPASAPAPGAAPTRDIGPL